MLAVAAILSSLLVAPAATATCTATVLPSPPGTTVTAVTGTDGAGTYVGVTAGGGVRWRDGQAELLPENFVPYDMNRSGVIAGSREVADVPTSVVSAVLLAPDGTITTLATGHSSGAAGLNEKGDAVGWLFPEHPIMHLTTVWRAGSEQWEELDPGWYGVRDIDDNGLTVGAEAGGTRQRVWDLDGNVVREFGPYAPAEPRYELADIDDGRIAATRVVPNGVTQVFLLDVRAAHDAPLPGSQDGHALAVDNGVVAGYGPQGAMLWRRTGATTLPAPDGLISREATVVTNDGTEAAGLSMAPSGEHVPTLWHC